MEKKTTAGMSACRTGINYLDLPEEWANFDKARAAVISVPFDGTSTWKKGADLGPAAILDTSCHLELYDIETDTEPYKNGIYTQPEPVAVDSLETMLVAVHATFNRYADKRILPVFLGGEHSISIGAIRAAAARYPRLTVLQLDAHTDLRHEYEGTPYNHACVMARAREKAAIVQVGIRSMDVSEKESADFKRIFTAESIQTNDDWMEQAVALLTDDVYITVDLDVFDPSVMPATGTPEPGGLSWYEVTGFLRRVFASQRRIVGFDLVELCPNDNYSADFLAARLLYKMLGYYFFYGRREA